MLTILHWQATAREAPRSAGLFYSCRSTVGNWVEFGWRQLFYGQGVVFPREAWHPDWNRRRYTPPVQVLMG